MHSRWVRFASWLAILVVLLAFTATAAPARAQETDGYLPDEVVVKLDATTSLPAIAQRYGLDPNPIDQFGSRPIYRLRIADRVAPLDKAAVLANDPQHRVIYAEPNYIGQTPEGREHNSWAIGGDSGTYAQQWAPGKIRLPEAHQQRYRGTGMIVAVLDTGVDGTHPALAGRLLAGFDFVDLDNDPSEVGTHQQNVTFGHGTHVAGLVALTAPEARIMPLRVLDRNGAGNIWVLAEALGYAAEHGANVISMSLSTLRPTNLLREIVGDVTCDDDDEDDDDCLATRQRGVVVVAAAGNGRNDTEQFPAAEDVEGLLAVAASTPADRLAGFSTRGSWVQVAAPGDRIVSSVPGGGYGTWSGTSMAAPLAAGQAALLRSAYPNLWSAQVADRIIDTAAPLNDPWPPRIDVAAALGIARP